MSLTENYNFLLSLRNWQLTMMIILPLLFTTTINYSPLPPLFLVDRYDDSWGGGSKKPPFFF